MKQLGAVVAVVLGCHGDATQGLVVSEVDIPMRDGVKLHTKIYAQPDDELHGVQYMRSPYEPFPDGAVKSLAFNAILVEQSVRGRYKSEGSFALMRPPAEGSGGDDSTDAYDTIVWLLAHVPHNNGHVVAVGQSYGGWTALMTSFRPHPAVACAIEMAAMGDVWMGDDLFHHGAFRLSYGFEYSVLLETVRDKDTHFAFDLGDTYDWYLRLGALTHADERYLHGKLPTWEAIVHHPDRDEFWKRHAVPLYFRQPTVPTLHVAGWWDQEDPYGPIAIYRELASHDSKGYEHLLVGPWNHGGWYGDGTLGAMAFPASSFDIYQQTMRNPFIGPCYEGQTPQTPPVQVYESGTDRWVTYDQWPPPKLTERRLYLRANHTLAFDPPTTDEIADTYVSDPANPIPYRHRPISPTYPDTGWAAWLVEDQRFVDHRPDVLTFETPVLDHEVAISGELSADLWASTTGTDADWVVKLIDVLPQGNAPDPDAGVPDQRGFELIVSADILRGRYRDSWEHPTPIPANEPQPYHIDLHTRQHAFRTGHRIMVQIQSTWFPLYDRNPQQFVPNIFAAQDSDFIIATQSIVHTPAMPSAIVLHMAR